jgi:mono/diheme cytochrome c family protein
MTMMWICSHCNLPQAFEREMVMMLRDLNHRVFASSAVISVILGILIVGCSTTEFGISLPGGGSSVGAQDDPPGDADSAANGKNLFTTTGCVGCHTTDGKGGLAGPDVSNEAGKGRSREWIAGKIRNPKVDNPQTVMPACPTLSDEDVDDLVNYLLSLPTAGTQAATGVRTARGLPIVPAISASWTPAAKTPQGQPAAPAASTSPLAVGGKMWSQRCGQCHNLRPASQYSDAQWAVAMHHMRIRVPLTGEEQRNMLKFLQATN